MAKKDPLPLEPAYNPLDRENLAKSVTRALLAREPRPLPQPTDPRFMGAGIYAIYYSGGFRPYSAVAKLNKKCSEWPLYVGKAVPKGRRKGLKPKLGADLFTRLLEHTESIELATNLELDHFRCRSLVVDDVWIPLAETYMIQVFKPLWNRVVEGFGIHNPGKNRPQKKSAWDSLHPGRAKAWKVKLKPPKKTIAQTKAEIKQSVKDLAERYEAFLALG